MRLLAELRNRGEQFRRIISPNPRFLHTPSVKNKLLIEPKSDKERLKLGLPLREPWFEVKPFDEKKKNIILGLKEILVSQPSQSIEVADLGQLREELNVLKAGKQKKIVVFVRKYPRAFSLHSCYNHNNWKRTWCRFTNEAQTLLEEEKDILDKSEPQLVNKLRKVLMISMKNRLRMDALEQVRQSLGLPFDFRERLIKKYPQFFALKERKGWLYVELCGDWDEGLAVSTLEKNAMTPDDGKSKKKKKKKKDMSIGDDNALQAMGKINGEKNLSNGAGVEEEIRAISTGNSKDVPRSIMSEDSEYVCGGMLTDDSEDVHGGIFSKDSEYVHREISTVDLLDMHWNKQQAIQTGDGDGVDQGIATEDLKDVYLDSHKKNSIECEEYGRGGMLSNYSEGVHGKILNEDPENVCGGMSTDDLEDVHQDSHGEISTKDGEYARPGILTQDLEDLHRDSNQNIPTQGGKHICGGMLINNLEYVHQDSYQRTTSEDGEYVHRGIVTKDSGSTTATHKLVDNISGRTEERQCLRFSWKNKRGLQPRRKKAEEIEEFQSLPYVSPYKNARDLDIPTPEAEKFAVGMIHEFLNLTLEKRMTIDQLEKLRKPYRLPDHLMDFLIKYDGIFYVVKGEKKSHVFLKEAYKESLLIEKETLVIWQERFVEFCLSSSIEQDKAMKCEERLEKKNPVFKGYYYKGSEEYFGKEGYKVPSLKSKT